MNVLFVNYSRLLGGAARAAARLACAVELNGCEVFFAVSDDDGIANCYKLPPFQRKCQIFKSYLSSYAARFLSFPPNEFLSFLGFFSSNWPEIINELEIDVVHLHWISAEMMSYRDVMSINKRIVWTIHDMWPLTGSSHVEFGNGWKTAYCERFFFEINKLNLKRKQSILINKFPLIAPSKWMYNCLNESLLFKNWPVYLIPNSIDTNYWKPLCKSDARKKLNIDDNIFTVLFVVMGDLSLKYKGFDLLKKSLDKFNNYHLKYRILLVGSKMDTKDNVFVCLGSVYDDDTLRLIYNAVDIVVIPSRIDNFPNVGLEALSMGVPIVSYAICGLNDLVLHMETGYLAKPFDTDDFARGLAYLYDETSRISCSKKSRDMALRLFSNERIGKLYRQVYDDCHG